MKTKKIIYFAFAALLALGLVQQAACMKPSSPHKDKRCIECDVCFSLLVGATAYDLQQKLCGKYEGELTERWIQAQPCNDLIKHNLRGWAELEEETKKFVSGNAFKEIDYNDGVSTLRVFDLRKQQFCLLVRSVGMTVPFLDKLSQSLTKQTLLPDFEEVPYTCVALTDQNKKSFDAVYHHGFFPVLYVLAINPSAILDASPIDRQLQSGSYGSEFRSLGLERMRIYLDYSQERRFFDEANTTVPSDILSREVYCREKSPIIRRHPDALLQQTGIYNNEVVVDAQRRGSTTLVALAIQKKQWETGVKRCEESKAKEFAKQLQLLCDKHKLPLFLLDPLTKQNDQKK
jgi:hypothetical protein